MKETFKELRYFLILWLTQSFSALGSSMTNFALVLWLYGESGSALTTALLSVCSYAPYVLMSIFAGALSDRWDKRRTMLVCDSLAAVCTLIVAALMLSGRLEVWHLYILNAVNGLMNTVQQPASDVAITLLTPPRHFQRVSGLRSFSNSLVTILTPVLATAVMSFFGIFAVFAVDMITFLAAFLSLLLFIRVPDIKGNSDGKESTLSAVKSGLKYLKTNLGILWLILFLAAINLIASMYDAMLPALILPRENGGENALGWVNPFVGIATLAGSIIVTLMPAPKSRIRMICNTLLFSMGTENFLLAFGRSPFIWCVGAVLGWISIPIMNGCLEVIFRTKIPTEMQGRVYSARNTFQFFTIPI